MSADQHQSVESSFETDGMGFYMPKCSCGWVFGPVPDLEIVADVLMAHAYEAATEEARRG